MVLVKITEIKSTPNPDTGKDGKQIQFGEFRQSPKQMYTQTSENKMIDEMMGKIKSMGFPMINLNSQSPKLILFITEHECEELQINLEVNKIYDLKFWMGKLELNEVKDL